MAVVSPTTGSPATPTAGRFSANNSSQWRLQYEFSPIILTGGTASQSVGGSMSIATILEGQNLPTNLDDFFAHFQPIPGSTILQNDVGMYPFANQATAANAIITRPLAISMLMVCPSKTSISRRLSIISTLQQTLAKHINAGGTFMVATPSFVYTDCLLTAMRDASGGESHQPQFRWQLDFVKPLITLADAKQAQNSLTSKMTAGVQVPANANGEVTTSGPQNAVGAPGSGAATSAIPATTGPGAAGATSSGLGYGSDVGIPPDPGAFTTIPSSNLSNNDASGGTLA
jgi:hypothetical protein